jgi:uncharacterized glyoxalase superfamily protein PhnB
MALTGHATVLPGEDVDRLYGEFSERGAEMLHGPIDQEYGAPAFHVRDPDGHILAFGKAL